MMKTTAQDVMTTRFHTLQPGNSIAEAVRQFKKSQSGRTTESIRHDGHRCGRAFDWNAVHV